MVLTVNAEQLTLANHSSVESVPLVVLETFSDRDAETIDQTRYWTRTGRGLLYTWDGSNDQAFEPVLSFVSPINRGFEHLPDSDSYTTRDIVRLECDGGPRAGEYLWQALLAENIIGARVTIASVLIDPTHIDPSLGFSAAVHVVRWRGEVTRLSNITAEGTAFSLVCESQENKLGSTVFIAGDQGADVPVILDATLDVVCTPSSVRYQGTIQSETIGDGGDENIVVIFDGDAPPDVGSETYPVTWTKQSGDDSTGSRRDNIWYASIYSSGGVRDLGFYEQIDNPGAGGGAEVDIVHTLSLGANAVAGNIVRIGRWPMAYAIGGGYVRDLTRVLIESAAGVFNTVDIGTTAGGLGEVEWYLSTDESDPENPVSFINFVPHSRFDSAGDYWAALIDYEDVTLTVDVGDVWGAPSGAWTQILDPDTFGLTVTDTAAYQGDQESGSQYDVNYTQFVEANSSDVSLIRSSGTMLLASTGTSFPESLAMHFRTLSPGVGDKQFEVTFTLLSTEVAKIQRVHLAAKKVGTYGRATVRTSGCAGYRLIKQEELVTGSNTFTFEAKVDDPSTDELGSVMILIDYNDITTNKSFQITGDGIRARSLSTIAAANHPTDAVETIVDDFLPGTDLSIDASTFATAKTNTPGVAVTPDLTLYPTLGEYLAAVGFSGRINFVFAEGASGTVVKAFAAETDFGFSSPIRAIGSTFADMGLELRPITEVATRFAWLYDLSASGDGSFAEDYRGSLLANKDSNPYSPTIPDLDFSDAETSFGKRESIVVPLPMLRDLASVLEVTGYYVSESLRGQVARYSCRVPYWIGYDLEPGDIVSIQPSWEAAPVKVRLLRIVFSFDEHSVGLVLEAVT